MSDQYSSLTVKNLTTALKEVIDWKLLGVQLKMNVDDLKTIECDYSRLNERKIELYRLWLKKDPQASWENVLLALKQMDLHDLARRVQSEFCPAGIKGHQLIPEQKSIPEQSSHPVSQSNTERGMYRSHQWNPKQYNQQSKLSPGASASLVPITTGVVIPPQEQRFSLNEQPPTTPLPVATSPNFTHVVNMSPVDRLRELEDAIKKLERKFRDLVFCAQEVLSDMAEQSRHFLSKLRTCLFLLPATLKPLHLPFLNKQRSDIFKASSVGEIICIVSCYWSFINSSLLQHLIDEFGDEHLKTKLDAYLDDVTAFEGNTVMEDFVHVRQSYLDLPPNFSEIVMEMKDEWAHYSLAHVCKLCQDLAQASHLKGYSILFTRGSCSTVIIVLAVPTSIAHLLATAMDDVFCQSHGVNSVHIERVELHAYQRQCVQRKELHFEREATPPFEDLVKACRDSDVMRTLQLLDEGADVNGEVNLVYGKQVNTPLTISSRQGHSDIVSVLLCSDADVNKPDRDPLDPWTPLMLASRQGCVPVVHLLLEHHADVNIHSGKYEFTALYLASHNNHPEIVHLLLEARANVDATDRGGETALMTTSSWGYMDVVQLLLAQGANVNLQDTYGETAVFKAILNGHSSVVQELLQGGADPNIPTEDEKTALMRASREGHLDVVRLLLAQGANVNLQDRRGGTALMEASRRGYLDVVRLLLAQGANMDMQDTDGETAVFKASMWGRSSVVQELLQGGADPNIPTEEGLMPLIVAIKRPKYPLIDVPTESRIATVEALLTGNASVEIQEQSTGWTALFFAANEGIVEIVRLLIQHGANPSAVDKQGLTPLDVARDQGYSDVCKELKKSLTTEAKEIQYQEPDSEEPLTTESQEPPQQSYSETTGPGSEVLVSQQPAGVEETTRKGVLPETESNRSKSVRKRMEEARRRILAVFGRLQEKLLQSRAEKTRALAEQQEIPYPHRKEKEEILLEKVQD